MNNTLEVGTGIKCSQCTIDLVMLLPADYFLRGKNGSPLSRYSTVARIRGSSLFCLCPAKEIDGVSVEEIPCTVLNMEFFDRLWQCGVVRESGRIVKCFDEVCGDFIISDKLREV